MFLDEKRLGDYMDRTSQDLVVVSNAGAPASHRSHVSFHFQLPNQTDAAEVQSPQHMHEGMVRAQAGMVCADGVGLKVVTKMVCYLLRGQIVNDLQ